MKKSKREQWHFSLNARSTLTLSTNLKNSMLGLNIFPISKKPKSFSNPSSNLLLNSSTATSIKWLPPKLKHSLPLSVHAKCSFPLVTGHSTVSSLPNGQTSRECAFSGFSVHVRQH